MLLLQGAEKALWNGGAKEKGKEDEDRGKQSNGEVRGDEDERGNRWNSGEEWIGGDG